MNLSGVIDDDSVESFQALDHGYTVNRDPE